MSGAAWPAQALPPVLKTLSYIFPSTPMVNAFIRLRIFGAGLQSIRYEYRIMLIQMMVFFILAVAGYAIKLKNLRKDVMLGKLMIPE